MPSQKLRPVQKSAPGLIREPCKNVKKSHLKGKAFISFDFFKRILRFQGEGAKFEGEQRQYWGIENIRKVRKKAKTRNRYNQVPHLTQDTVWESDKNTGNITYKRAKRSALSQQLTTSLQETYMSVWLRQTQITNKIHKRSTALER